MNNKRFMVFIHSGDPGVEASDFDEAMACFMGSPGRLRATIVDRATGAVRTAELGGIVAAGEGLSAFQGLPEELKAKLSAMAKQALHDVKQEQPSLPGFDDTAPGDDETRH